MHNNEDQILDRAEAAELESLLTEFHAVANEFVRASYNGFPNEDIIRRYWIANAKVEMRKSK